MEDGEEKIIVFKAYDTVVEANLAKTKLDAYGIPCFLTDENFVSLYPIRNEVFPGVRLHIFEIDFDQVNEMLLVDKSHQLKCPNCGASQYELMSVWRKMYSSLLVLLDLSSSLSAPKEYHCNVCRSFF